MLYSPKLEDFLFLLGGLHLLEPRAGDAVHAPLAGGPGDVALQGAAYEAEVITAGL